MHLPAHVKAGDIALARAPAERNLPMFSPDSISVPITQESVKWKSRVLAKCFLRNQRVHLSEWVLEYGIIIFLKFTLICLYVTDRSFRKYYEFFQNLHVCNIERSYVELFQHLCFLEGGGLLNSYCNPNFRFEAETCTNDSPW